MPVLLRWEGEGRCPLGLAAMRRRAERMLQALSLPAAELSVLLCEDPRIRELNAAYRGKDRPTDVLAFAMAEGHPLASPDGTRVLGDVVISLPTAAAQAERADRDLVSEVTVLLAHGLLHLLGFDHQDDAQERRMKARTDLLVAAATARVR